MFSAPVARQSGWLALFCLPLAGLIAMSALDSERWFVLAIALGLAVGVALRTARLSTVRIITSPSGIYIVNCWRTFWVDWNEVAAIDVDSWAIAPDLLDRLSDDLRERLARRPDAIVLDPLEGPRLVKAARIRTKMGQLIPIDALTVENLVVMGAALKSHRNDAGIGWSGSD